MKDINIRLSTASDMGIFRFWLEEDLFARIKLGFRGDDLEDYFKGDYWNKILVAGVGDEGIVGFVKYHYDSVSSYVDIKSLYVHAENRHQGVGRALLLAAEKKSLEDYNPYAWVLWTVENQSMEQLVRSLDYEKRGTIRGLFRRRHKEFNQAFWLKLVEEYYGDCNE